MGIFGNKTPHCPKCKSTNIQVVGQRKKAFSLGKATVGAVLTGGVGVCWFCWKEN